MSEQRVKIKRDGLNLAMIVNIPETPTYDVAVLAYGFMGRMDPSVNDLLPNLATRLQAKGLATIRFDFNGHGDSDGPVENMSIYNELEDYRAVFDYARNLLGRKKIYLIGHSQGGVLSAMMAGFYADQVDKLVLMSSAATLVDDARLGTCTGVDYDPNHVPNQVVFPEFNLNDWYFRTAKFINVYDVARTFSGPTLILHGEQDEVVNNYASQHFAAVMSNTELHLISGSDHGLHQNREEVYERVVDFLIK